MLTKSQAIVFSTGSLAILALTSLMLAGMLGTGQWFMFSLAVFLAADAIAGHYANGRLNNLSALVFFISVVVFFIAAAGKLLAILGILL
jgi:hypothetical protein